MAPSPGPEERRAERKRDGVGEKKRWTPRGKRDRFACRRSAVPIHRLSGKIKKLVRKV